MMPIKIDNRNVSRLEVIEFPPGLSTKTAKANYALGLGLDLLQGLISPQDTAQQPISGQHDLRGIPNGNNAIQGDIGEHPARNCQ